MRRILPKTSISQVLLPTKYFSPTNFDLTEDEKISFNALFRDCFLFNDKKIEFSSFEYIKPEGTKRPFLFFFNEPTKSWWIVPTSKSFTEDRTNGKDLGFAYDPNLLKYILSSTKAPEHLWAFQNQFVPICPNMVEIPNDTRTKYEKSKNLDDYISKHFLDTNYFKDKLTSGENHLWFSSPSIEDTTFAPSMAYIMHFLNFAMSGCDFAEIFSRSKTTTLDIETMRSYTDSMKDYFVFVEKTSAFFLEYLSCAIKDKLFARRRIAEMQNYEKMFSPLPKKEEFEFKTWVSAKKKGCAEKNEKFKKLFEKLVLFNKLFNMEKENKNALNLLLKKSGKICGEIINFCNKLYIADLSSVDFNFEFFSDLTSSFFLKLKPHIQNPFECALEKIQSSILSLDQKTQVLITKQINDFNSKSEEARKKELEMELSRRAQQSEKDKAKQQQKPIENAIANFELLKQDIYKDKSVQGNLLVNFIHDFNSVSNEIENFENISSVFKKTNKSFKDLNQIVDYVQKSRSISVSDFDESIKTLKEQTESFTDDEIQFISTTSILVRERKIEKSSFENDPLVLNFLKDKSFCNSIVEKIKNFITELKTRKELFAEESSVVFLTQKVIPLFDKISKYKHDEENLTKNFNQTFQTIMSAFWQPHFAKDLQQEFFKIALEAVKSNKFDGIFDDFERKLSNSNQNLQSHKTLLFETEKLFCQMEQDKKEIKKLTDLSVEESIEKIKSCLQNVVEQINPDPLIKVYALDEFFRFTNPEKDQRPKHWADASIIRSILKLNAFDSIFEFDSDDNSPEFWISLRNKLENTLVVSNFQKNIYDVFVKQKFSFANYYATTLHINKVLQKVLIPRKINTGNPALCSEVEKVDAKLQLFVYDSVFNLIESNKKTKDNLRPKFKSNNPDYDDIKKLHEQYPILFSKPKIENAEKQNLNSAAQQIGSDFSHKVVSSLLQVEYKKSFDYTQNVIENCLIEKTNSNVTDFKVLCEVGELFNNYIGIFNLNADHIQQEDFLQKLKKSISFMTKSPEFLEALKGFSINAFTPSLQNKSLTEDVVNELTKFALKALSDDSEIVPKNIQIVENPECPENE